ncbi:hypothetical protein Droror1_Dr00009918 [Drosera rotundifolia]
MKKQGIGIHGVLDHLFPSVARVYTQGNNKWRSIETNLPSSNGARNWSGCEYAGGMIYWPVMHYPNGGQCRCCLLYFDVEDELFHLIDPPETSLERNCGIFRRKESIAMLCRR